MRLLEETESADLASTGSRDARKEREEVARLAWERRADPAKVQCPNCRSYRSRFKRPLPGAAEETWDSMLLGMLFGPIGCGGIAFLVAFFVSQLPAMGSNIDVLFFGIGVVAVVIGILEHVRFRRRVAQGRRRAGYFCDTCGYEFPEGAQLEP